MNQAKGGSLKVCGVS